MSYLRQWWSISFSMSSPGGSGYSSHHSGGGDRDSRALTEAPPPSPPPAARDRKKQTGIIWYRRPVYPTGFRGKNTLLTANFSLIEKVGKTTRPFRFVINEIPYNYTVEVTNRFTGWDLIECLKNNGRRFMTLYRRRWSKPSPRKRSEKGKMVVWGGLTNSWKKKRS